MKKILVTGANKGIGLGIVTRLLRSCPDTFVYLGCRDTEKGHIAFEVLVKECADWVERLCVLEIDVADQNSLDWQHLNCVNTILRMALFYTQLLIMLVLLVPMMG